MSAAFFIFLASLASGSTLPIVRSPDALVALTRPSGETPVPLAASTSPQTAPQLTVVHFWATWCGTCTDELPEIRRLQAGVARLGQRMLFVALDPPSKTAKVAAFMAKQQLYPSLGADAVVLEVRDPAEVTRRFDPHWAAQLPATFIQLESGPPVAAYLGKTPVDVVLTEVSQQLVRLRKGSASVRAAAPPAGALPSQQ